VAPRLILAMAVFGKLFGNPFRDEFFSLLGRRASLDHLEHGLLRDGRLEEAEVNFLDYDWTLNDFPSSSPR
jgi:hypothetical protein